MTATQVGALALNGSNANTAISFPVQYLSALYTITTTTGLNPTIAVDWNNGKSDSYASAETDHCQLARGQGRLGRTQRGEKPKRYRAGSQPPETQDRHECRERDPL